MHNILELRKSRETETRLESMQLLDQVESEQQRIADDIGHVLVALTEMGLGRLSPAACQDTLLRIRGKFPPYLAVSVSNRSGIIWCSTQPQARGMSVADRSYWREALTTGEQTNGATLTSRTTGRPSIPFALAYKDENGAAAGVVTVLLDTTWLTLFLREKSLPDDAEVVIADRSGIVLAHQPETPDTVGRPLHTPYQALLDRGERRVVEAPGSDGRMRITAVSPLAAGVPNLYVHVSLDKDESMRPVNAAARRTLVIFAGLFLFAGLTAGWSLWRFLRAHELARSNALRMAAVLGSTVDGVIELDRDWRFTYLNDKAVSLVAQGRDLRGRSLWDAFPELVDTPLWHKAHQAMVEQVPTDAEFRGMRTGRWFWMRAFPNANGMSVYLLDITRRRQAEDDLRKSKDRLSLALESAMAGSFDWDLTSGQGHWSEETYRIFGLDPAVHEATSAVWRSVVHPDDFDIATLKAQSDILAKQQTYVRLEYRIIQPGGAVRWVSSIGRVNYGEDGTPLHFSGLNLDITERKALEEALRRSEERLTIALTASEAGIWDFDRRDRTLAWSDGMYRLYGVSPDSFKPNEDSFFDLVHPADRDSVRRFTNDVLEARRSDYRGEFRILHPRDGVRWIMAIGRPVYENGRLVRLSGLNIDITGRKAMEEALRDAKAKADDANVSKSKFLAAASHDLRQPLQSALLFAGVLQRHIDPDKGRGPLASLERALETLKNLLDSLLDVSRLDAGVITPQIGTVPLRPMLEEIEAAYVPIAASKGLEFTVAHPALDLAVRSDRLLLGRMLRNLVENAIRYTEAGYVRVSCQAQNGMIRITVQDSGIGISAEQQTKVFEEFHQVGNPERDRSQGLGLGLAIVKRLSRLLSHPVSVRSEPAHGSVFSIEAPRAAAPTVPLPAPEAEATPSGEGRLAVLIEDDVIVLMGLRTIFQEWGYEVAIAGSTEQAVERLRGLDRRPDLIVADYRLRNGRIGTEAIVQIRGFVGSSIPAIILTGEIGTECDRDAAALGLAVVRKPVAPRQLQSAIQDLLNHNPLSQAGD
ncbi:PAS domain-containing sensor histidine kinase (plasmid) [Azospirillum brasilense]|uniref:histidine kinase n=2 Tax=Azospirillum brasilense TaxID=192 RepID=A0A235HCF5_AZOBR|nr:PAS domain-containing sensor histidine kinase [Azospirillum brasilense]